MAKLNDRGHEILDNTPIEMPIHMKRPESLVDQMRRMIRTEFSAAAQDQGFETFEEADDFDVDDDHPDPTSPWEMIYEPDDPGQQHPGPDQAGADDSRGGQQPDAPGNRTQPDAGTGKSPPQAEGGDQQRTGSPGQTAPAGELKNPAQS